LAGKKAIINPQKKDNECFRSTLLAAMHPVEVHAERISNYAEFKDELDFTGIPFPVILDDILNTGTQQGGSSLLYLHTQEL
jgi:hypothetical protein